MKLDRNTRAHACACACALLGLAAMLAPTAALAAGEASAPPQRVTKAKQAELRALQQRELAACRTGQTGQELSACVREAHASYAEALRGGLDDGGAPYAANARQRCEALSGSDRSDCLARVDGHGTTSGSVESSGVLRELKTYSVDPVPKTAASAPAAAARPAPATPR
ncbi:MAG: hypothetical protein Q8K96_15610 [Rubrivivax sp.]|nr:hypothetical protein [Rubrivivax sp.]